MRYKVIYDFNNASGNGDSVITSFYTSSEAFLSANEFVLLNAAFRSYVWDGSRWSQID